MFASKDPHPSVQATAPAQRSTARGIVQIVLGIFLIALMGTITLNMAPMLLAAPEPATDGSRLAASQGTARLILALFLAVMAFGAVTIAHGLILARTGMKPRKLLYVQWAVAALILILGALVMLTIG